MAAMNRHTITLELDCQLASWLDGNLCETDAVRLAELLLTKHVVAAGGPVPERYGKLEPESFLLCAETALGEGRDIEELIAELAEAMDGLESPLDKLVEVELDLDPENMAQVEAILPEGAKLEDLVEGLLAAYVRQGKKAEDEKREQTKRAVEDAFRDPQPDDQEEQQ